MTPQEAREIARRERHRTPLVVTDALMQMAALVEALEAANSAQSSEDEFTLDGVRYVALHSHGYCAGCAFQHNMRCGEMSTPIPSCLASDRTDGRSVIFIRKENQT